MRNASRTPTRVIQTATQLGLLLLLACPILHQPVAAQPTNLDIIVQRDALTPPTMAEIELVWDGGAGPNWAWSIEVDGIEDHIFQGTTQASQCDDPDALINCRSGRFMVALNFAEIVTIRAAVFDSEVEAASGLRRVRMGTNESFWIDSVTRARITPGANGTFNCDSDDANDPPWITLSGDDRSFPLIDVFRDARISLPDSLVTWDITPDPENPAAEILYIIDRINQSDEFDGLAFPLQYGSIQADTRVLPEPPIAPLRSGRVYQIRLTGVPFPCEFISDGSGSPLIQFMLNPPAPGDPVILQGPAEAAETAALDPALAQVLDRQRQLRLQRDEGAIAACVNEALTFEIIAFIAARGRSNQVFGIVDELVVKIFTDTEVLDKARTLCAADTATQTDNMGNVAAEIKAAASTPDFDLEVISGSGRVTLPDATTISEIRTAHASVIVTGGAVTIDIAQTDDAEHSAIGSPDTEIVVTPNNPALSEITVPAGFFVTLSDTSVSAPTEFALFADGFE